MAKIELTQEDFEFLKELQHELNTQPNDGNADPVFWGVMETEEVGVPENCGDPRIYIPDDCEDYTLEDAIEYVNEWVSDDDYDDATKKLWSETDKEWIEDVADFIKEHLRTEARIIYVAEKEFISRETGAFITKRACKEYIDRFGYNHNKPHTYAMTAYRNFEYERLLKILKTMKLDDE